MQHALHLQYGDTCHTIRIRQREERFKAENRETVKFDNPNPNPGFASRFRGFGFDFRFPSQDIDRDLHSIWR